MLRVMHYRSVGFDRLSGMEDLTEDFKGITQGKLDIMTTL